MAEIKRYLYNGLGFKIDTGITPIIVNETALQTKSKVPQTIWTIDFGDVTMELKNAIEHTIFLEPNNTTVLSYVGPHFYIGKRINPVGDITEYYLTYIFEYAYYSTFVNKPLSYIVDGTDHLIEGTLRIPIAQTSGDTPIVFDKAEPLPRKMFYLAQTLGIAHKYNNVFNFKIVFNELAKPLAFTNLFIVGVSDAYDDTTC